jgi:predicted PurR-regulated permease PerM
MVHMKEADPTSRMAITTGSWVRGAIVVALAYAIYQVSGFILVLIMAIVIASAIEPVTQWAKRRAVPRLPTVIGVYIIGALFLAGFFYFLLLPLIGEVSSFMKTLTVYSNSVVNGSVLSDMFETEELFGKIDTKSLLGDLNTYLNNFSTFLSKGVFSTVAVIFGGVASFIIMIVLSFYLAVQEEGITKFLKTIVPLKHENYAVSLWRRSQLKIGYWMQGQLMLGVLVMVLVYIGLIIIGVPHALLLAVLAGVLELIPLFGATLAAIPALFVAYAAGGVTTALIVAALYLVIQQLENHVIYPMVVKKMVGVPAMVSILAIVIGAQLAGFLGVLISVPVAAVVMEFLNDLEERKIAKLSQAESKG